MKSKILLAINKIHIHRMTLKTRKKRNRNRNRNNKTRKRICSLSPYHLEEPFYQHVIEIQNSIRKFSDVQICLAKKEQSEYLRPMVHLHIYNDTRKTPVYLLGGMGPLSDVQFLKHLKKLIKNTTYNIHLFSLPPPRSVFQFHKIYCYTKMLRYIQTCVNQERSSLFLLSNSAHLYRHYLDFFHVHTFDMIPSITKSILSHTGPFLVLSTHHDVYTEISNTIHIDSRQTQIILESVHELKENRYNHTKNPLLNMILAILKPYTDAHIVLACTELSIWYELNRHKIPKWHMVHDTSNMMSRLIFEHIQKKKKR